MDKGSPDHALLSVSHLGVTLWVTVEEPQIYPKVAPALPCRVVVLGDSMGIPV